MKRERWVPLNETVEIKSACDSSHRQFPPRDSDHGHECTIISLCFTQRNHAFSNYKQCSRGSIKDNQSLGELHRGQHWTEHRHQNVLLWQETWDASICEKGKASEACLVYEISISWFSSSKLSSTFILIKTLLLGCGYRIRLWIKLESVKTTTWHFITVL